MQNAECRMQNVVVLQRGVNGCSSADFSGEIFSPPQRGGVEIAQHFSAGKMVHGIVPAPEGRLRSNGSAVLLGLGRVMGVSPALKCRAISRPSLRDVLRNHTVDRVC